MERYSAHSEPGKLLFRSPRVFNIALFLLIPLIAALIIYSLIFPSHPILLAMKVWDWIFLTVLAIAWLRNWKGKSELQFTPTELIHRDLLFGLSRTKRYKMSDIRDPRFVISTEGRHGKRSGIGFDYHGREIRVCPDIAQPEAKEIVAAVLQQFPELAPVWGRYVEGVPEGTDYVHLILR
ncbi:MAG: hypothetical protein WBP79_13635 [Candidatus Acidiferrales bacterium]